MISMKHLLILLISASFIGCSIFDPSFYTEKGGGEYIPKGNPGSCYAKCLMPSQKKQNNISFFEYTGDTPGVEGVVECN